MWGTNLGTSVGGPVEIDLQLYFKVSMVPHSDCQRKKVPYHYAR